jgi:RNA recognition motif-containing protein
MTRLFVCNFPFNVTEHDLRDLFGKFGTLLGTTVLRDRDNRSKGHGFVEFAEADHAAAAIEALSGANFRGRTLRVEPAHERSSRPRARWEK